MATLVAKQDRSHSNVQWQCKLHDAELKDLGEQHPGALQYLPRADTGAFGYQAQRDSVLAYGQTVVRCMESLHTTVSAHEVRVGEYERMAATLPKWEGDVTTKIMEQSLRDATLVRCVRTGMMWVQMQRN